MTQLWVKFRVKLTDFRVIVDPEWSLAPITLTRVFLECTAKYKASFMLTKFDFNVSAIKCLVPLNKIFTAPNSKNCLRRS